MPRRSGAALAFAHQRGDLGGFATERLQPFGHGATVRLGMILAQLELQLRAFHLQTEADDAAKLPALLLRPKSKRQSPPTRAS